MKFWSFIFLLYWFFEIEFGEISEKFENFSFEQISEHYYSEISFNSIIYKMSRKNKTKKYRNRHKKDLEMNRKNIQKMRRDLDKTFKQRQSKEDKLKDLFDDMKIEKETDSNKMIIEKLPRKKKITKNKLFQKRMIKQEKKRLRKMRKAPILVSTRMDLE